MGDVSSEAGRQDEEQAADGTPRPIAIVALSNRAAPLADSTPNHRKRRKLELARQREANKQLEIRPPLSEDELVERMRLRSSSLVDEVQAIALRLIDTEDKRESRLDAKAQGLLGSAGLSLTVAFTFGGLIFQQRQYLASFPQWLSYCLVTLYVTALVAGLASSVTAVLALLVTNGYRNVDEETVFSKEGLSTADVEEAALPYYRRYMTVQYWQIAQKHYRIHEEKARLIKRGQILFVVFLLLLMLIGVGLGLLLIQR
jgi:hypothetical protein